MDLKSLVVVILGCSYSEPLFAVEIRYINQAANIQAFDGEGVFSLAVNPRNPSLLAASSQRGEIALLDKDTLSIQWRYYLGDSKTAVMFSNDGKQLAAVGGCLLSTMNVLDGTPLQTVDLDRTADDHSTSDPGCNINYFGSSDIIFTRNNSVVYVAQSDRVVKVDLLLGRIITLFGGKFDRFWGIMDIRLSDDERFLYVEDERDYFVFDAIGGALALKRSHSEIRDLPFKTLERSALSRDGKYTVFASQNYAYVVDNTRGQIERKQFVAADRISALEFSHDLTSFMLSSWDGSSRIYNIATGVEEYRLDDSRSSSDRNAHDTIATGATFDGIYTGDSIGNVWLWAK